MSTLGQKDAVDGMKQEASGECDDSRLCEELHGGTTGIAFIEIYGGDPPSRVVHQTEHFAVICDLAPLVEGHLLLLPKPHVVSFGRIASDLWRELLDLSAACETNLTSLYEAPIVLEHGSSTTEENSACVTHAHWHFLPTDLNLQSRLEADGLKGKAISSPQELSVVGGSDRPYIYYRRASTNSMYVFDVGLRKGRQYIRSILGDRLGIPDPEWDWAHTQRKALLRSGYNRLRELEWPVSDTLQ